MNGTWNRNLVRAAAVIVMTLAAGMACAQKADPGPTRVTTATAVPPATPGTQAAERFKAAGKAAPLAVVPTRLGGKAMPQVGEAIAMMLERAGMTDLEISSLAFDPPEKADLAQTAKAFADFVRANPAPAEYSLFTEFMGSPRTGMTEVRGIVVNKQGEIVWQDRQAKGDTDFDRIGPREPLQCCLLIVDRLRPVLGLGDPRSEKAPEGRIAQRWQKNSGVPDKVESDAIQQRGAVFKTAAASATLLVYPAHAGDAYSPQSATDITAMINERKLTKAIESEKGPRLEIAKDMNEQKMLWAMARGFSEHVKKNPPNADYVLFADYLMGKDAVGGVHFAVCNRQGELVVVDFQNNHWPDFLAIDPKTREDCDKLVVKRLEGYCK